MNDYFTDDDHEALREIRQLEAECRGLLEFIQEAAAHSGQRYRHHVPAMLRTVERLRARCESEINCLHEWREDYRQPDEIEGELSRQFSETCRWLARMVGPPPSDVKGQAP